ncbi:MAG: TonB family protein [Gemmatimonadota bacterium]
MLTAPGLRRWILGSTVLHVAALLVAFLLTFRGSGRELPPVYQVNLVQAAELAAQPRRPRPEEVESEPLELEPEEEEKVPDPEEEPSEETTRERPREEPGPDTTERETAEGDNLPVTLEGRPFQFPWYLEEMVRKVQRNWRPPGTTSLKTTIYFRIERTGRVTDMRVETSSGHFTFDQAAQRAIQAASPMPPLPGEYSSDYLGVYFDFDATVRPSG